MCNSALYCYVYASNSSACLRQKHTDVRTHTRLHVYSFDIHGPVFILCSLGLQLLVHGTASSRFRKTCPSSRMTPSTERSYHAGAHLPQVMLCLVPMSLHGGENVESLLRRACGLFRRNPVHRVARSAASLAAVLNIAMCRGLPERFHSDLLQPPNNSVSTRLEQGNCEEFQDKAYATNTSVHIHVLDERT